MAGAGARTPPQTTASGRRSSVLVVLVVSAALVAVTASGPALGIASPALAQDLALSQGQLTLVSTAGTIVTAALLLPIGLAADRRGRRRFLVTGLIVFGVAEVTTAALSGPVAITASRALAAVGAACVLPTSLAVLVEAFPRDQRARAVAIWAAVSSASASAAGLVSGALTTATTWRSVPLLVGALALLLVPLVRWLVPDSRTTAVRPDVPGALLALVGIAGLVLGVNQAGAAGLATPGAWVPLLVGVLGLTGFVAWELVSPAPMLPVRAFTDPVLRTGAVLLVLVTGSFGGFTLLATQYLQFGRGLDPLQAALAFAVTDAGLLLVTPLVPRAVRRLGVRWVGVTGSSLVAAALAVLAVSAALPQTWVVLVSLGVLGAGFAFAITPAATLIVSGLPQERLNTASALSCVNRDVGTAVGSAVAGAVLAAVYSASLLSGLPGTGLALSGPDADQAASGIAAAATVAQDLGEQGRLLSEEARQAFLDGFRAAAAAAGALALLGAVLCAVSAPRGLKDTREISPVPLDAPADRSPAEVPDGSGARHR